MARSPESATDVASTEMALQEFVKRSTMIMIFYAFCRLPPPSQLHLIFIMYCV